MKNFSILKFLYSYLLIIQLSIIKNSNIFKQIEQNDEIIYIYPHTLNKIYYTTLKSSYMIENDEKKIIKENIFNFTSSTRITIYDESQKLFFASCTKNYFGEFFTLSGTLIDKSSYPDYLDLNNIIFICPIHFYHSTSKLEISYSTYIKNETIIRIGYEEFTLLNNKLNRNYIEYLNSSIGNYFNIDSKKHFEQIHINNKKIKIFKYLNYGLVYHFNGNNFQIEDTKSEFKIAFIEQDDAIIYYFENKLKLFYMNNTGNYRYEIDTINSFDFENIELSEMINNGNELKFICVYKSKDNNHLFIELYKLNGYIFQMENYYEITNNIGISKIYFKKVNQSSEHFILLRGSDINQGKYEYLSKENIDIFKNSKTKNCISKTESYLTTSKTNIKIKISEISNLSSDDILILYPNDLNYKLIDNTYIEITITKDNGEIEFNTGFKTNYDNNYILTHVRIEECKYKIQICNIACSHCTQIQSENNSPTKCTSKKCNEGYYYLEEDDTECIKKTFNCYETCNTCFENGNGIEHKCKTCKFGYEKYDNNCIKCDMNRKYWYYDSNLNNNECLYNNNCPNNYYLIEDLNECVKNCPNDYYLIEDSNECVKNCPNNYYLTEDLNECVKNCPNNYYLIEDSNECVKNCPNDYYLNEDSNECVKNCPNDYYVDGNFCIYKHYYYYDSNNIKVNIGENGCDNNHPYLIYNSHSKECLSDCLIKNLYLISNSKFCIDKCEKINLILKNNECVENKNNEINIKGKTLDELVSKIEEKLDKLKQDDNKIIDTLPGVKVQVYNSSKVNDINSNYNLGSVDLGECENILKKHYNLDPSLPLLIVLINTISKTNSLVDNVNYNVYSQDGKKLDLKLCSNVNIKVYNSITKDGEINLELIKQLTENGINLFDINDEFYNDRCFSFILNGNDVSIDDRKNDIYTKVSVCEPNCTFIDCYSVFRSAGKRL